MTSSMRRLAGVLPAAAIAVVLGGCQAELDTTRIEAQEKEPIQRFDLFQAIADNGTAIVVVGSDGQVVATADKGETWTRTVLPRPASLIDVDACPDGRFVAVDFEAKMWQSEDDGKTWAVGSPGTEESVMGATCDERGRIWVYGSFGTIAFSTDKGASWNDRSTGDDLIFTTFAMLPDGTGYAFGEFGTVMKTTDGGDTWEAQESLGDDFYPMTTHFKSANEGWVGSIGGLIMYTGDGGATWTTQQVPEVTPVYGFVEHKGAVYASGNQGLLFRHDNGAWRRVEYDGRTYAYLKGLLSIDGETILAAGGQGSILRIKL